MTPPGTESPAAPLAAASSAKPACAPAVQTAWGPLAIRLGLSGILAVVYLWFRQEIAVALAKILTSITGIDADPKVVGVWLVAFLMVSSIAVWWKQLVKDKRYHAPILVTCVLIMGDAAFGVLEEHTSHLLESLTGGLLKSYSPTFIAILTACITELILGTFYYGKRPHLSSAYVSGISAGILIKSPALWPFILGAMISIASKYVLRIGDRHLWNPTNCGMTIMLFLAPQHVASLSIQAGNEVWSVVVIWVLGGLVLWNLGRLHIPIAFIVAFIPLSIIRAMVTHHLIPTELAPMTSPMFQLYILFMITDPKSTTKSKWSQVWVAVLVAVMETVYRLAFKDIHSLYHALFTVGPITNLIEMAYFARAKRLTAKPSAVPA